jgi:hypothetical protein
LSALSVIAGAAPAEPLDLDRLLELLASDLDVDVIASLVEKDCVTFEVTGENVRELSDKLPKSVLQAAIECATPRAAEPAEPAEPATDEAESLCHYVERIVEETVRERGFATLKRKRRTLSSGTQDMSHPGFRWSMIRPYPEAERCWIEQTSLEGELLRCDLETRKKKQGVDEDYTRRVDQLTACLPGWTRESIGSSDGRKDWMGVKFRNADEPRVVVLLVRTTRSSALSAKRAVQLRVWNGFPVAWGS